MKYIYSAWSISFSLTDFIYLDIFNRCAEILLKDITKQVLNELEETAIPQETPLLLAAENGHANASLFILDKAMISFLTNLDYNICSIISHIIPILKKKWIVSV